jgi:hypothetical protein
MVWWRAGARARCQACAGARNEPACARLHTHTYMHTHTYTHTHMCKHTHPQWRKHTPHRRCTHTTTCTHANTHPPTNTHTHTTHTVSHNKTFSRTARCLAQRNTSWGHAQPACKGCRRSPAPLTLMVGPSPPLTMRLSPKSESCGQGGWTSGKRRWTLVAGRRSPRERGCGCRDTMA